MTNQEQKEKKSETRPSSEQEESSATYSYNAPQGVNEEEEKNTAPSHNERSSTRVRVGR